MIFGMIFRLNFVNFMKMCSPPRQEAHFRKPIFANIMSKAKFPFPKWLQNHHFGRGISLLCCSKTSSFRRLSGKWPSWEALFNIACIFACILDQIFTFSLLILSLLQEALFNVTCIPACLRDQISIFSFLILALLWEALFNVTCILACLWDQISIFSLLIL